MGRRGGRGGRGGSCDGWWTCRRGRLLTDGPHQLLGLGQHFGEIFGQGIFQEIDMNLRAPWRQTNIHLAIKSRASAISSRPATMTSALLRVSAMTRNTFSGPATAAAPGALV